MNDSKILPEDPRLTAYALGEMDAEERSAFEAQLRNDPHAVALVEEIRGVTAQLERALRAESDRDAVRSAQEKGNEPGREPARGEVPHHSPADYPARKGKILSFPQLYYLVGGLAAACFAVVMAFRFSEPRRIPIQKRYEQVALPPSSEADGTEIASSEKPATADNVGVDTPPTLPAPPDSWTKITAPAVKIEPTDLTLLGNSKDALTPLFPGMPPSGSLETIKGDYFVSKSPTPTLRQARGRGYSGATTEAQLAVERRVAKTISLKSAPASSKNSYVAATDRVTEESASSFASSSTLAGTRVRTDLMDTATSLSVVTPEFLRDTGAMARSQSNRESYAFRPENEFVRTADEPLSTFSADVDTASYANVRRFLKAGQLPPKDAVRIEELVNYFPYQYAEPKTEMTTGEAPFAAALEVAEAPWALSHRLVRIGLKAREVTTAARGPANLVFLLDVSGSMDAPNRLPLVKDSLRLLLGRLRSDDRVAIVTYAGTSGLALPSTPVAQSREILAVLDSLSASGGTNGGMGIRLAYDIAKANFVGGGVNRVILCTDGDFNVGVTGEGDLVRLIEKKAKTGVFLTVLGFGMGNLQDATMQQIADHGNGNYAYIDTREEAEKMLVRQLGGTLVTVAKDVKFQVEFNPKKVSTYRLIGYEKRLLKAEDFNREKIDAGEVGAGHTVTVLYEVVPVERGNESGEALPLVDPLRYGTVSGIPARRQNSPSETAGRADELLTVKVRFKEPTGFMSRKLEYPLRDVGGNFAAASEDFKFAAAVASFGLLLRDSPFKGSTTFASVEHWATEGKGADPGGYREEFIGLVKQAEAVLQ